MLSVETAGKMTDVIPNCRLVTAPDAGHSIPPHCRAGFVGTVKPFVTTG